MFSLDKAQAAKMTEWANKHKKVYTGAIGGRYTYSFTPTSIGLVVKVKDAITGEEIDLTDYDMW